MFTKVYDENSKFIGVYTHCEGGRGVKALPSSLLHKLMKGLLCYCIKFIIYLNNLRKRKKS